MSKQIDNKHDLFLPLIHAATPKLYEKNLFWALKVPYTTTERTIKKQLQILKAQKNLDTNSKIQIEQIDDSIRGIETRYRNPELRFLDEFFTYWTINLNHEVNLSHKQSQTLEEQLTETLEALNKIEQQSRHNPLTLHDAAVFAHFYSIKFEDLCAKTGQYEDHLHFLWSKAIYFWKQCADEETIWTHLRHHIRTQSDPRMTTGLIRRFRKALLPAIYSIHFHYFSRYLRKNHELQARYHIDLLERQGASPEDLDIVFQISGENWINQITYECNQLLLGTTFSNNWEECLNQFKEHIQEALKIILEWFKQGSTIRAEISDRIADTIFKFTVKHSIIDKNYQSALLWLEYALEIADSDSLRRKIEHNIQQTRKIIHSETCWFCNDYLSQEHSQLVLQSSIFWREILPISMTTPEQEFTIPRCPQCKKIHRQHRNRCFVGSWAGAVSGIAGVVSTTTISPVWLLGGAIVGMVAGYGMVHQFDLLRTCKITKPLSHYKEHAVYQQWIGNESYKHTTTNEFPRKV